MMNETILKEIVPKNKAFRILDNEFKKYGWKLSINELHLLVYLKPHPYDEFIICVNETDIDVSVPIPHGKCAYRTTLQGYFQACEFIQMHLEAYHKCMKTFFSNY